MATIGTTRTKLTVAPFFVMGAAILWSFDGILRRSLYALPPTIVVFYEHLFGALVLLCCARWWWGGVAKLTRKEWFAIALVSLLSGAIGTIFYTAALGQVQYIPYSVVVLLQQLEPFFAIGMAHGLLKERLSKRFLLWAGVALGAVYLLSFPSLVVTVGGGNTIASAVLAIGASAAWGISTAVSKYVLNATSFLTATALRFLLTPLFAGLFIVLQGQTSQLVAPTPEQWQALAIITGSTGMVALALYYFGLKQLSARVTTLLELTWPAAALLIDYFVIGTRLTFTQLIGMGVLAIALYQVQKGRRD